MALSARGLSAEETSELKVKLQKLKVNLLKDADTLRSQEKSIAEKDRALTTVYEKLKEIKKAILAEGGALSDREFRESMRTYLLAIREEVAYLKSSQTSKSLKPLRAIVVLSGAAGQIGYSMIPLLANGAVFGLDQPLELRLLEIAPALKALSGVAMEINDGSYPLVEKIVTTADANEAFADADYAILVGGFPRKAGMERKDLLAKNAGIFKAMGAAIEASAKPSIRVLVVANPANTNCLICATSAPKVPKENFSALTRLDHNRATSQVAEKIGALSRDVKNIIIWGNHSATQVPDVSSARRADGSAIELDAKWVRGEFTKTVQQRGKAIIQARGFSSAMSAANASKDALRDLVHETPAGVFVSMAVWSTGNPYGIADGIFYSFPVTTKEGRWTIVSGLPVADDVRELMQASEKELLEEKAEAGF